MLDTECRDAGMPGYWMSEILDTGDLDTKDTGCWRCRMLEILAGDACRFIIV